MKMLTFWYRLGFGLLTLVAVAVQFWHGHAQGYSSVNFFSYFTIESNIFAAAIFLLAAAGIRGRRFDLVRGAAALYMTVTGVIYVILLSGADVQTTIPWVNAVLHYIFPVVALADWLLVPLQRKVPVRTALFWLVFPLAYAGYSLIRGHFANWYPYPFLNVMKLGYIAVTINCLFVATAFIILTLSLARLPRAAKRG